MQVIDQRLKINAQKIYPHIDFDNFQLNQIVVLYTLEVFPEMGIIGTTLGS